jgi:hypothetical protein
MKHIFSRIEYDKKKMLIFCEVFYCYFKVTKDFFHNTLIALNVKTVLYFIIELSSFLYLSMDLRAPPFYIQTSLSRTSTSIT